MSGWYLGKMLNNVLKGQETRQGRTAVEYWVKEIDNTIEDLNSAKTQLLTRGFDGKETARQYMAQCVAKMQTLDSVMAGA